MVSRDLFYKDHLLLWTCAPPWQPKSFHRASLIRSLSLPDGARASASEYAKTPLREDPDSAMAFVNRQLVVRYESVALPQHKIVVP